MEGTGDGCFLVMKGGRLTQNKRKKEKRAAAMRRRWYYIKRAIRADRPFFAAAAVLFLMAALAVGSRDWLGAVSYTHLTLPTIA